MTGAERQRRYVAKGGKATIGPAIPVAGGSLETALAVVRAHLENGDANTRRAILERLGLGWDRVPTSDSTHRRLVWQRKAREASGMASDAVEYIVAQLPNTDEFEVNVYEDSGDFRFIGDGFRTMAEAERAAEQHNADRMRA
jgi:hypothetical protein